MSKAPKFTTEQVDWICYQIGEWYLKWRMNICDYTNQENSLGYAKEELKLMICPVYEDKGN